MFLWSIVGDALIVRSGESLQSDAKSERLVNGAVIQEVEIKGQRLHYKLVSGTGPREGWISTKLKDRALAERLPLTGYPAPGDRVKVYSVRRRRWFNDGIVQEVIVQDSRVNGKMLANGSIQISFDNFSDSLWIHPREQPQLVRRAPMTQSLNLTVGDAVLVWSISARRWFDDGTVRMIAQQDLDIQSSHIVKGSVFVVYGMGGGVKWLSPSEMPELLRLKPRNVKPAKRETAEVVATEAFEPGPSNVPLLALNPGDELLLYAWYGHLFGYCYGKLVSDGSEGWFPAESIKPVERQTPSNEEKDSEEEKESKEDDADQATPSMDSILEDMEASKIDKVPAMVTTNESPEVQSMPMETTEESPKAVVEDNASAAEHGNVSEEQDTPEKSNMTMLTAAKAAVMQELARTASEKKLAKPADEPEATPQKTPGPPKPKTMKLQPALEKLLAEQFQKSENTLVDKITFAASTLTPVEERKSPESIKITDNRLAERMDQQRAKCHIYQ